MSRLLIYNRVWNILSQVHYIHRQLDAIAHGPSRCIFRAVYFAAYHKGKAAIIRYMGGKETPVAHIGGAMAAGG